MTSKSTAAPGRLTLLDVVVLIAMAVTAAAFSAGLIVNSGIDLMAGVIAGAALYMVMAASHYVITRQARSASVAGRMEELEEALIVLDGDLQRIDQVEDDVARLDLLTDKVERLDQAVAEYQGGGDLSAGAEQLERLSADLEHLQERLGALRSEVELEARTQREQIGGELKSLEGLIKDLSRELTAAAPMLASPAPEKSELTSEVPLPLMQSETVAEEPLPGDLPAETLMQAEDDGMAEADVPQEDDVVALLVEEVSFDFASHKTTLDLAADEATTTDLAAGEPALDLAASEAASDAEMLGVVRQAIDASRIDLYLQPIVALPERKLRYYDTLTRIRTDADDVVLPGGYMRVAELEGLMPRIDNVMLVKSVQLLRRLGPDSKLKGVFCTLSAQSLLDRDFFPELVEFLEENSTLGDSLTFQLSQRAVRDLGASEFASLKTLGKLGFCFALDHFDDLDADFAALRDHFFRFVKIDAESLLRGTEAARAPVPAAEMTRHLDRFDLKLIVAKVEDEESLDRLVDYGVEFAQGDLFAEPKPVSPEMVRELEDADAAFA
jgi:cyclic-di-GMP phosphodiesterase TipF (flagellum assembly factor)